MIAGLSDLFPAELTAPLLVGLDDPDDAAVYRLDGTTIVVTADYFPPVVDDAYAYGAIAAANALSDVYAMGGQPLLALNLACLPDDMPPEVAAAILRGGAEKVREAGAVLAGGHTTQGDEPTYGLAVVGRVDERRLVRKAGACPGDVLVLTKPLGSGVVTTAAKQGVAGLADLRAAIASMSRLNRDASLAAARAGVRCGTDVTGFGLLGHALELARASGVELAFDALRLPFLPGARDYATFPGGEANNRAFFGDRVTFAEDVDDLTRRLAFSPETAGGLLLAVPPAGLGELADVGLPVGRVEPGSGVRVGP